MKLFLDNFNFNKNIDLDKFYLCFDKCWEYGISLNLEKSMFLVHSRVILGYINVSKRENYWIPKRFLKLSLCHLLRFPKTSKFSMGWLILSCFIQDFAFIMAPITKLSRKVKASVLQFMVFLLGFLVKNTQNDRHKKNHLVNLDKSIWTCQYDWVINLDLVIMTNKVIYYHSTFTISA
jgi:hypothetical protein